MEPPLTRDSDASADTPAAGEVAYPAPGWQRIAARVLSGHQVASGRSSDPRFPGGTLHMQAPFFLALGLDLAAFHPGTLNVGIAPLRYHVLEPFRTFRDVRWHPTVPAEHFSFFDVRLVLSPDQFASGLIYYPHPETKPEHFQPPDALELLLPFVENVAPGAVVCLEVPVAQMRFTHPEADGTTKP